MGEPSSVEVSGSWAPVAPSTALQFSPAASQRCQPKLSVAAGSLQLPPEALSVPPSTGSPERPGSPVTVGAGCTAAATTALGADIAWPLPPAFVALTTARKVEPTSPEVSGSWAPVAPSTALQFSPAASQRCQPKLSVAAGSLQAPPEATRVTPSRASPKRLG